MNTQIKSSLFLIFIPILVLIPLSFEIAKNLHFGGINLFFEFFISALTPKINKEIIYTSIIRLNETIFIAFVSWIISILFGALLGVLSSDIIHKILNTPIYINRFIRYVLTIFRSLHELVWGLILIEFNGVNLVTGILAICIPYISINAKVIGQQIEFIDFKTIQSITQLSNNRFTSLITLIWIPIIKTIKNFGQYRLECALRSSAILGFLGLGGLGTSIFLSFQALNFRELWTYLWILSLLIIISKRIFINFKINKLTRNISIPLLIIFLFFNFYLIFILSQLIIKFDLSTIESINLSSLIDSNLFIRTILRAIFETVFIGLLATAITISLPPFLLLISQNKTYVFFLRVFSFLIRLIPPPILILILLIFNQPSISLAALTLGLHNASISFKLLNQSFENSNKKIYFAIKSLGGSQRASWLYGLMLEQFKSYISYCSYRSDILIRETFMLGIIGSIGLGWELNEAISSFAWNEVFIILFAYSSIAIVGEIINGNMKKKFT